MRGQDSGARGQVMTEAEKEKLEKLRMVSDQIKVLCRIHQVGYFGAVLEDGYHSTDAVPDPRSKTIKEGVTDFATALTNLLCSFRLANSSIGISAAENDELISMIVSRAKEKEAEEEWSR